MHRGAPNLELGRPGTVTRRSWCPGWDLKAEKELVRCEVKWSGVGDGGRCPSCENCTCKGYEVRRAWFLVGSAQSEKVRDWTGKPVMCFKRSLLQRLSVTSNSACLSWTLFSLMPFPQTCPLSPPPHLTESHSNISPSHKSRCPPGLFHLSHPICRQQRVDSSPVGRLAESLYTRFVFGPRLSTPWNLPFILISHALAQTPS